MGASEVTDSSVLQIRSPVNWAVLGLLIERPDYGYNLYHRFARTYGGALQLSTPSQVYGALEALERKGLTEKLPSEHPGPEPERQPKPRYRATALGRCGYQDWLIAQVTEKRQQSELLARQLAAIHPRAALAILDRYEQECLHSQREAHRDPSLAEASPLARKLIEEEARLAPVAALNWIAYAREQIAATLDERGERGSEP